MMDDEIFDGKVLQYLVTLSYDGHVKGVEYLGLDDAGRPDAVDVLQRLSCFLLSP